MGGRWIQLPRHMPDLFNTPGETAPCCCWCRFMNRCTRLLVGSGWSRFASCLCLTLDAGGGRRTEVGMADCKAGSACAFARPRPQSISLPPHPKYGYASPWSPIGAACVTSPCTGCGQCNKNPGGSIRKPEGACRFCLMRRAGLIAMVSGRRRVTCRWRLSQSIRSIWGWRRTTASSSAAFPGPEGPFDRSPVWKGWVMRHQQRRAFRVDSQRSFHPWHGIGVPRVRRYGAVRCSRRPTA